MKKYVLCTAVICLFFSSGAQAKGCIKGALVGKADAEKNAQTTGSQPK